MTQSYHAQTDNSNPNQHTYQHRQPIPGGSFSIPPVALLITWAAYRLRKINWLTFRVWLALHQLQCWRDTCAHDNSTHPYTLNQIARAIKSNNTPPHRIAQAINSLHALNLAHFSPNSITFAQSLTDVHDPDVHQLATNMLNHLGNDNASRPLRMPRRMLVFLMTITRPKPVFAGVMLGLLLRCMMYKRYNTYKGCCTATWLAAVFGGDITSVKSARSQLINDGWFIRLPTAQRVRQQHGEWLALVLETAPPDQPEIEPPPPRKSAEIEPPLINQSLSNETETNQSLQSGALQNPSWHHITFIDLTTPNRRRELYHSAVDAEAIPPTPASELTFYAAIAHACRVATRNPCGLLRHIVETPTSQAFISQTDEDRARTWISPPPPPPETHPSVLSSDALFVMQFRRNLKHAGFHGDPYTYLTSTPQGQHNWPPERWLQATVELLLETAP